MSTDFVVARLTEAAPATELPPMVFKFDHGVDGTIVVDSREAPVRILRDADLPADCTIKMALPHLELIVRGRVTAGAGFMKFVRGATGDLSLTMRVLRLLRTAAARPSPAA